MCGRFDPGTCKVLRQFCSWKLCAIALEEKPRPAGQGLQRTAGLRLIIKNFYFQKKHMVSIVKFPGALADKIRVI